MYAEGATDGCTKNMYISGDSIYSYGPHFPIARRLPGGYIFNSDNSSVSTAKHKSRVYGCIAKDVLWELPGCLIQDALEVYAERVLNFMSVIPRSKSMFPRYLDLLVHNFEKAIEAHEKLGQDIQPLYNIMDREIVAAAIKRIKKDGKVPGVMLTVFGKAKFLSKNTTTVSNEFKLFRPDSGVHSITILPYPNNSVGNIHHKKRKS
jgi:hypothetical protein